MCFAFVPEKRMMTIFGNTIINMPIEEKSAMPSESRRLKYNVHESFGFLTGEYLVLIGGQSGIETWVEYIGTGRKGFSKSCTIPIVIFLYTPCNKHITKWLFRNCQKSHMEVSHAYQLSVIC